MEIIIGMIGGLGLFLFGMKMMSDGLQKAAGKKLERIIEVLTTNRFMGVIVGILVTGAIQSSSATTVMVVGFVNAGIMKLSQAVGVIMGANIGTTVTGQMVSLSVDQFAPIAVGIGMLLMMLSKKDGNRNWGEILIGLGILFFGMEFLKDSLQPLREMQAFNDMMITLSHNPVLGVLVGFVLTFVVQSSSASIGMLIALAAADALPLTAALPILYGDNIGTCTTALLSSIGAGKNAKRAAVIHLSFNIIGTLLFVIFLTRPITSLVTFWDPTDVGRQIANAHTIFNLSNVILQFPFAFILIKIAMWLIPETAEEQPPKLTRFIDDRILETPGVALQSAIKETLHMGRVSQQSFKDSMEGFFAMNADQVSKTFEIEKHVNFLEKAISDYLVKLSNCEINEADRRYIDGLFNNINDIERIGDHADNIAELAIVAIDKRLSFSEGSFAELREMYNKSMKAFDLALEVIEKPSKDGIFEVMKLEEQVDQLEKDARNGHIQRLNRSECSTESGIIFLDIVSNLERVSDLSSNLVRIVSDTVELS